MPFAIIRLRVSTVKFPVIVCDGETFLFVDSPDKQKAILCALFSELPKVLLPTAYCLLPTAYCLLIYACPTMNRYRNHKSDSYFTRLQFREAILYKPTSAVNRFQRHDHE